METLYTACYDGDLDTVKTMINGNNTSLRRSKRLNPHQNKIISVDEPLTNDFTSLMVASYCGHFDIVKFLVSHQADITYTINDTNAITFALRGGHTEIADYLKNSYYAKWFLKNGIKCNINLLVDKTTRCERDYDNLGNLHDQLKLLKHMRKKYNITHIHIYIKNKKVCNMIGSSYYWRHAMFINQYEFDLSCKSYSPRFSFYSVSIKFFNKKYGHVNLLIYDRMNETVYRFEPNGCGYLPEINTYLKKYFKERNVNYVSLDDTYLYNNNGPQEISDYYENNKTEGRCLYWSYCILEIIIENYKNKCFIGVNIETFMILFFKALEENFTYNDYINNFIKRTRVII